MNIPSASTELLRQSPLVAGVAWLNYFVSAYGAIIIFMFALTYGIMQIVLRRREHKAIMRKHQGLHHGKERRNRGSSRQSARNPRNRSNRRAKS